MILRRFQEVCYRNYKGDCAFAARIHSIAGTSGRVTPSTRNSRSMLYGNEQSSVSVLKIGFLGRCPRCCKGNLFSGFLSTNKNCDSCELDFGFADSGDGPAIFIIMIVGFLIIGGVLAVEIMYQPPYWVHGILWLPLTVILSLCLLRPFKATLVALQYRNNAQLGRIDDSL